MNKSIATFIILCILDFGLYAKPRKVADALNLASTFHSSTNWGKKSKAIDSNTFKLAYTCKPKINTRSLDIVYYYVFNMNTADGFIIVSGDDRAKPILGYSDNGTFCIDSIPDVFKTWLSTYEKELSYLISLPENPTNTSITKYIYSYNPDYKLEVQPLLGNIRWNQGYPYNLLCPIINPITGELAVTGCVATAMAQIMKYHRYPSTGIGNKTYVPRGFTNSINVDFSQSTYDWDNMLDMYDQKSTNTQKNAVAKLMYDCGVSVSMNYGPSSGALTTDMAQALIKNFGYDPNIQYYTRDYCSYPEWIDLLKKELNAARPILYGGNSTDVGHQFICDGYNNLGLFHFNWGWGGRSDGYFEISALNPGSLGTGGGFKGGYNYNQDVIVGVQQKGTSTSSVSYVFTIDYSLSSNITTMERDRSATITVKRMFNAGINTFRGERGIALYSNNTLVEILSTLNVASCSMYSGWASTSYTISIPASVPNGAYKLYSVYKGIDQTTWQIANAPIGVPNCLNVDITSSSVSFSMPDEIPKLTLNYFKVIGNLYQYKAGEFSASITNFGSEYYSLTAIYLGSINDATIYQYVVIDPTNIPAGATKEFKLIGDITLPPGDYNLYIAYDPLNNRFSVPTVSMLNSGEIVTILSTPTQPPSLILTSKIVVPNNAQNNKSYLTAQIKNIGGYFYNKLVAFVYPEKEYVSVGHFDAVRLILDTNEEKTITLSGYLNLPPNQYTATLMYWDVATSRWLPIAPEENGTTIFSSFYESTNLKQKPTNNKYIYYNESYSEVHLCSDEIIKRILISNIAGKIVLQTDPNEMGEIIIPIAKLNAGTYIIQVETAASKNSSKIFKIK